MKIALTGTEGTGKTTLAKAVSEKYSVQMIPEFARDIAKEMNILNLRKMTLEETFKFQQEVVNRKVEAETRSESFIADRSTADNLAYWLRWCGRDVRDELTQEYFDKCIKQLKTYDHVFILPWNSIPHETDGFRTTKLFYKYEIHCLILGILEENKIAYEFLLEKNFDARVNFFAGYYNEA